MIHAARQRRRTTRSSSIIAIFVYAQFLQYRYAFSTDMSQTFVALGQWLDTTVVHAPAVVGKAYAWLRDKVVAYGEQSAYTKVAAAMRQQREAHRE